MLMPPSGKFREASSGFIEFIEIFEPNTHVDIKFIIQNPCLI